MGALAGAPSSETLSLSSSPHTAARVASLGPRKLALERQTIAARMCCPPVDAGAVKGTVAPWRPPTRMTNATRAGGGGAYDGVTVADGVRKAVSVAVAPPRASVGDDDAVMVAVTGVADGDAEAEVEAEAPPAVGGTALLGVAAAVGDTTAVRECDTGAPIDSVDVAVGVDAVVLDGVAAALVEAVGVGECDAGAGEEEAVAVDVGVSEPVPEADAGAGVRV